MRGLLTRKQLWKRCNSKHLISKLLEQSYEIPCKSILKNENCKKKNNTKNVRFNNEKYVTLIPTRDIFDDLNINYKY